MKKILFLSIIGFSISSMAEPPTMTNLPAFLLTDKEITKTCADAVTKTDKEIQAIVDDKREPTFENTVVATENSLAEFDRVAEIPVFLSQVSTNGVARQASSDCEIKVKKFAIDIFSRPDLFSRFNSVKNSPQGQKLSGEDKKLLEDHYAMFLENGADIADKEKQKQVQELSKQIKELQTEFSDNLREDKRFIQVDKSELAGLPEDWITHLEKTKSGKYVVTTDYPDAIPFMKNAKSENARKRLYEQFSMRGGKKNVMILEKTLKLRSDLAKLTGYADHADRTFSLKGRMAMSTAQVRKFLEDLYTKLEPYLDRDLNDMRKLKCKETKCKDWDNVVINPWDAIYYVNEMEKITGGVDEEKVKEYFPLDTVIKGMFSIYQTLLSVEFEKISGVNVWDPAVEVYVVRDKASHDILGHFYLDLFPRDGKYNHAAVWGLIKPRYLGNADYQTSLAAMVCNFPRPTADQPSLLHHSEVEVFFHEFGHVMDAMTSRTKYYSHGGETLYSGHTGTPRDFVEAPSQMLENWVWNPTSLAMLSGHYKTGEKLPKDLLDRMIALKNVANGYTNIRQLFFATIDLDYHTGEPPSDLTKVWNDKMESMMKIPPMSGVYPEASFGHIMGEYDVGYYGYMWSKVYAQDMFSVFEKKGILDPRTGMKYRKFVYEPAGSQSTFLSIKNFLGRESNQDAFLKSLGIDSKDQPAPTK